MSIRSELELDISQGLEAINTLSAALSTSLTEAASGLGDAISASLGQITIDTAQFQAITVPITPDLSAFENLAADLANLGIPEISIPVVPDTTGGLEVITSFVTQADSTSATIPVGADDSSGVQTLDAFVTQVGSVSVAIPVTLDTTELDQVSASLSIPDIPVTITADDTELLATVSDDVTTIGGVVASLGLSADDTELLNTYLTDVQTIEGTPAVVPVSADTSGVTSGADAATASIGKTVVSVEALKGATSGFEAAVGAATGSTKELGAAASSLGPEIGAGVGAVAALGGAVALFADEGLKGVSATERLNLVFGGLAPAVQQVNIGGLTGNIKDLALSVGSVTPPVLQATANLGQLARTSNYTSDQTKAFVQNFQALALNAVAVRPSLGQVGDVMNSLVPALSRGGRFALQFGIALDSADINSRALAETGKTNAAQLTAVEKATAGAELAIAKYGDSLGPSFRRNIEQTQVQFKALTAQIQQTVIDIGAPLVAPVLEIAKSMAPAAEAIGKTLGVALQDVVLLMEPFLVQLGSVAQLMAQQLQPAFVALKGPIADLGGALGQLAVAMTPILVKTITDFATGIELLVEPIKLIAGAVNLFSSALSSLPEPLQEVVALFFDFGNIFIDIGALVRLTEVAVSGLGDLLSGLGSAVSPIVDVFKELGGTVITAVADAFGLLEDAMKPVVDVIGKVLGPVISTLTPIVETFVSVIEEVGRVAAVLEIGPIVLAVEGAFRLARVEVKAFGDVLSAVVSPAIAAVAAALDLGETALSNIAAGLTTIGHSIGEAFGSIGDVITSAFHGVEAVLSPIVDVVKNIADALSSLAPVARVIAEVVRDVLLVAGALAIGPIVLAAIAVFETAKVAIQAIGDAISAVAGPIANLFTTAWEKIGEVVAGVGDRFVTIGKFFSNEFSTAVGEVANVLSELAAKFVTLGEVIGAGFGAGVNIAVTSAEAIATGFVDAFGVIEQVVTTTFAAISDAFSTAQDAIGSAIGTISDSLGSAFADVGHVIQPIVDAFQTAFRAIDAIATPVVDAIKSGWDDLASAITTAVGAIIGVFETLGGAVLSLVGPFRDALDAIAGIVETVFDALAKAADKVLGPINKAVSGIVDFVGSIGGAVESIPGVSSIVDHFSDSSDKAGKHTDDLAKAQAAATAAAISMGQALFGSTGSTKDFESGVTSLNDKLAQFISQNISSASDAVKKQFQDIGKSASDLTAIIEKGPTAVEDFAKSLDRAGQGDAAKFIRDQSAAFQQLAVDEGKAAVSGGVLNQTQVDMIAKAHQMGTANADAAGFLRDLAAAEDEAAGAAQKHTLAESIHSGAVEDLTKKLLEGKITAQEYQLQLTNLGVVSTDAAKLATDYAKSQQDATDKTALATPAVQALEAAYANGAISAGALETQVFALTGSLTASQQAVKDTEAAVSKFVSAVTGALPDIAGAISDFGSGIKDAMSGVESANKAGESAVDSAIKQQQTAQRGLDQARESADRSAAKAIESAQRTVDAARAKLQDITLQGTVSQITAAQAALAKDQTKLNEVIRDSGDAGSQSVKNAQDKLARANQAVADAQNKSAADIKAANDKLRAALDPQTFIDDLNRQAASIASFQANLAKLVGEGFGVLAGELAKKGPETAGQLAQSLASDRSKAAVAEGSAELLTSSQKKFTDFAKSNAAALGGAGVDIALAINRGMQATLDLAHPTQQQLDQAKVVVQQFEPQLTGAAKTTAEQGVIAFIQAFGKVPTAIDIMQGKTTEALKNAEAPLKAAGAGAGNAITVGADGSIKIADIAQNEIDTTVSVLKKGSPDLTAAAEALGQVTGAAFAPDFATATTKELEAAVTRVEDAGFKLSGAARLTAIDAVVKFEQEFGRLPTVAELQTGGVVLALKSGKIEDAAHGSAERATGRFGEGFGLAGQSKNALIAAAGPFADPDARLLAAQAAKHAGTLIGLEFGKGVSDGISFAMRGVDSPAAASSNMGAIVEQALKDALGIKSPSTVAIDIGQQFVAGVVVGLSDATPVEAASKELAATIPANFAVDPVKIPVVVDKERFQKDLAQSAAETPPLPVPVDTKTLKDQLTKAAPSLTPVATAPLVTAVKTPAVTAVTSAELRVTSTSASPTAGILGFDPATGLALRDLSTTLTQAVKATKPINQTFNEKVNPLHVAADVAWQLSR